jgi:hypothetical protein
MTNPPEPIEQPQLSQEELRQLRLLLKKSADTCRCGHSREAHRGEYEITYCRRCNCDSFGR